MVNRLWKKRLNEFYRADLEKARSEINCRHSAQGMSIADDHLPRNRIASTPLLVRHLQSIYSGFVIEDKIVSSKQSALLQ